MEPPWEGGTKVCINGPGHMTKMAAMPIYGKNLKKSSPPEPAGRFPRNLEERRETEENLVFETVQSGPYSSFECFLCSLRN